MTIEDRLKVVKLAEIDCKLHSTHAREKWQQLKHEFREAATPWRIVTVGAVSGFLMGRSDGGNGGSVGSKLFGTIAQSLITTLGAGATAGMAAGAAADAAADATVTAVQQGAVTPDAIVAAAKDPVA
jgi:hypothetical protein